MHLLDLLVVGLYAVLLLYLGWKRRSRQDEQEYLLMGRTLTLPAFVLTLVSTWYGGILGVSEFSFTYGVSNWIVFGLPYYFFALLFAFFLVHRARKEQVASIPELLGRAYGPRVGWWSGWLVLLLCTPAPYLLTLGLLLHFFFGVSLFWGMFCGAVFSYAYLYREGLRVIVRTDIAQGILMYGGILFLFLACWDQLGSPLQAWQTVSSLSPERTSWHGGATITYLLVWFFIASWTLVSPAFHQRVYAARTSATARQGILFSVGFWAVFDFMTTCLGLYAFLHLESGSDPRTSFLALGGDFLGPGLYGMFLIGILAVVMSTLDSQLFLSGTTLGRDLAVASRKLLSWPVVVRTRLAMAVVLLGAILLALLIPSVVELYYTIGSLVVPSLLLPVLGALKLVPSPGRRWVGASLLFPGMAAAAWWLFLPGHMLEMWPPFYGGLLMALILWITGLTRRRAPSGGPPLKASGRT